MCQCNSPHGVGLIRACCGFLSLRAGALEKDLNDRAWASCMRRVYPGYYSSAVVQFLMILVFSFGFFNYPYLLDSSGIFWMFWFITVLAFFAGLVHYSVAFYLTLRDNIPRMVKTKNTVWLFVFTLVFFEGLVMAGLFWLIYVILWYAQTPLCFQPLCTGSVTGLFMWINIVSAICTIVLVRSRRLLGIPILDTFGL